MSARGRESEQGRDIRKLVWQLNWAFHAECALDSAAGSALHGMGGVCAAEGRAGEHDGYFGVGEC